MSLKSEVAPRSLLVISSETLKNGHTSLSSRHMMTDAETGDVRSICEIVSVHLNCLERLPAQLSDAIIISLTADLDTASGKIGR